MKLDTVTSELVGIDGNRWDMMRVSNWYINGADELKGSLVVPENNTPPLERGFVDKQLYIAMSPEGTRPIDALFNCILDIKSWMAENILQLNQDETEVLVVGPEAKRENRHC